jgi:6-phosphogluconolactonase
MEVRRLPDGEAVAQAAAAEIARAMSAGIPRTGLFSLVLAGGTTPRRAYEILAAWPRGLPWSDVHLFWGDERCVPPDAPDSNYAMAKAALLDHVGLPPENVHRVRGEAGAEIAAKEYDGEVWAWLFGKGTRRFDVVLLGMGEDGHTASLFPGNPATARTDAHAVPVETEAKAPRWRVSLTLPTLANAAEVMFLVTGAAKRPVLAEILRDPRGAADRYPAAAVAARAKRVVWFVDDAAHP